MAAYRYDRTELSWTRRIWSGVIGRPLEYGYVMRDDRPGGIKRMSLDTLMFQFAAAGASGMTDFRMNVTARR